MIVKISFEGHKILRQNENEIIIALSKHAMTPTVISCGGSTLEDFEANSALNGAYLRVDECGGFSVAPFH